MRTSSRSFSERIARLTPPAQSVASALDVLPQSIAGRLSPDLATRLARLQPRAAGGAPRGRPPGERVAQELGGALIAPDVVLITEQIALPTRHGSDRLTSHADWRRVSGVAREIADLGGAVCLDTETTGLAGGTGTVAFLVGTLAPHGTALLLRQWILLAFGGEAAMLRSVSESLRPGDGLVTYNGKPFDAPLLQTRYRMHGLADPLLHRQHLDLLPWVRRTRPAAWSDARLATVESKWMGLQRTEDVAGAEVPASWRQWLERGAVRPLALVLSHNRLDLLSLYGTLQRAVEHEPDDLLRQRRGVEPEAHAMADDPRRQATPELASRVAQRLSSQDSRPWALSPMSRSRISRMRAAG